MTGSLSPPPSAGVQTALRLRDLVVAYPDGREILRGTRLDVRPGERVALIGPNGAGKTTLFLAACGVLPPKAGRVELFDRPVRPGEFRPEVGLVFQNPDDQLFSATVAEDLAFGPANMGLSAAAVAERVARAVETTGIGDLRDRPPHHLSGGQKRMVAIAAILACEPQLVFYDEPSANLDLQARRRLIEFLQTAPQTMVVSTHDLELVLELCERAVLLYEGRVAADGEPLALLGDRALMDRCGLECPRWLDWWARERAGDRAGEPQGRS